LNNTRITPREYPF